MPVWAQFEGRVFIRPNFIYLLFGLFTPKRILTDVVIFRCFAIRFLYIVHADVIVVVRFYNSRNGNLLILFFIRGINCHFYEHIQLNIELSREVSI